MATADVGILIIGGGAVGLSIASTIAKRGIEVIHASVYYPPNSLKAKLCLKGNQLMYAMCKKAGIPHKNTGKLLVARSEEEARTIPQVLEVAKASGGQGLRVVDREEIRRLEPKVTAPAAIYCPTSGIVDSHALLQHFEGEFLNQGGDVAINSEVVGIERLSAEGDPPCFGVDVEEVDLSGRERKVLSSFRIKARCVINSGGLASGRIAAMAGLDIEKVGYRLHPTKGIWWRATKDLHLYPRMLIYPLPLPGRVGIHTTPDCYGGMRLGPYETWLAPPSSPSQDFNHPENRSYMGHTSIDLTVPEGQRQLFVDSVKPFLPFITPEGIAPDSSSIHAKIQDRGQPLKDWVIRHEAERGLPNFFNLIGIESPGLTASPAIGEYVADMVQAQAKL